MAKGFISGLQTYKSRNQITIKTKTHMAILNFQKPDKVIMIDSTEFEGKFEFRPLEPGYGLTVGNALRRVLLSSLEGFAITSVRIEGVDHEFSTIAGVVEDVTEMILNLKQVNFKRQIDEIDNESVSISISGQDQITAGDFQKFISGFQVLNKDLVICNLDPKVNINMEITIEKGRGYVPAEENKKATAPIGTIFTDSIYTPIKNVKYSIENFRVEQKTDYEKLVFEILTDGSIHPKDALTEAAKILIHHFMLFSDERITLEADEIAQTETYDEESLHMRQLLKTKLVDMDLSVRALNCLKAAEVDTLGDLVSFNKNDLMKFRNFGKKSLTELEELVNVKGLNFGMDLAKYKLDKD
ncbi:DNA-directed RNA polymerase subunit alpha [Ichthyenterobacterium magnum]|uniref:DNA-directed RNA polymerase subunit alpha n=2 Tax=Ichthyenterobacterium magnum TaxID=1230530 RepID=A0A420DFU7_9FLAO|nr:DNA-directed RNA polymerase subunit alpha [Ichthyenterobacterium magnum]